MECVLRKDPRRRVDAIAREGDRPVVAIRSDASPMLLIKLAALRGEELELDEEGHIPLPRLTPGVKTLDLILEGVNEGDDVQLAEVCEDGVHTLSTKPVGSSPFLGEPVIGFTIRVRPKPER
jgi:hypothetical protein